MSENLADKIYKELEELRKELQEKKDKVYYLESQMEALSYDLKGVAMIVEILPATLEKANETASISAFRNVTRLIEDISASMDATLNEENFFIS